MPEASITLRDGEEVLLRPIRPDDQAELREAFAALSEESRYRRFLAATNQLNPPMVRYLTAIDHHDHEALIALEPAQQRAIGVARYVRWDGRRDAAEAAVTVADDWQGRGVGTLLLEVLAGRARQEGIKVFTALMLADNDQMMSLLEGVGDVKVVDRAAGTVEVEVTLTPHGLQPRLRSLLRASRAGQPQLP